MHDDSKDTTLPIAREIVETYVLSDASCRGTSTCSTSTLGNHDLAEAKRRIRLLDEAFRRDGTRITENLDFA